MAVYFKYESETAVALQLVGSDIGNEMRWAKLATQGVVEGRSPHAAVCPVGIPAEQCHLSGLLDRGRMMGSYACQTTTKAKHGNAPELPTQVPDCPGPKAAVELLANNLRARTGGESLEILDAGGN